jgi:hypothetical protein
MSINAEQILKNVYNSYSNGEDYTIDTPPSSKVHEFNMALNELKAYITFVRRDMLKVSMTLTEEGLEYCMENFEEV